MKTTIQSKWLGRLLLGVVFSLPMSLFAQDEKTTEAETETATMKISFSEEDSIKMCKAVVVNGDKPIEGVEVRFYAKRFFSLLPLIPDGKAIATDENGEASVEFPKDLPGDSKGTITIIAKVEDDEKYGSIEAQDSVKWGTIISFAAQEEEWNERSLSGTGEKAPIYLLTTAAFIICGVWGILIYIAFSLVRIKRAGKIIKQYPNYMDK